MVGDSSRDSTASEKIAALNSVEVEIYFEISVAQFPGTNTKTRWLLSKYVRGRALRISKTSVVSVGISHGHDDGHL